MLVICTSSLLIFDFLSFHSFGWFQVFTEWDFYKVKAHNHNHNHLASDNFSTIPHCCNRKFAPKNMNPIITGGDGVLVTNTCGLRVTTKLWRKVSCTDTDRAQIAQRPNWKDQVLMMEKSVSQLHIKVRLQNALLLIGWNGGKAILSYLSAFCHQPYEDQHNQFSILNNYRSYFIMCGGCTVILNYHQHQQLISYQILLCLVWGHRIPRCRSLGWTATLSSVPFFSSVFYVEMNHIQGVFFTGTPLKS